MRVVATARCFYKGLREKGDVFDCDLEEIPPFMEAEEQVGFVLPVEAQAPAVNKKSTAKKKSAKPVDVAPDDGSDDGPDVAPNDAPDTPVSE